MSDPQPTTLAQVIALLVALVGGGGAVKGWDRWRNGSARNGRASRDTDRIVAAIHEEGKETREVMRGCAKEIADLRVEVAKRGT